MTAGRSVLCGLQNIIHLSTSEVVSLNVLWTSHTYIFCFYCHFQLILEALSKHAFIHFISLLFSHDYWTFSQDVVLCPIRTGLVLPRDHCSFFIISQDVLLILYEQKSVRHFSPQGCPEAGSGAT